MIESSLGTHPRVLAGLKNPEDVEGSKSMDDKSWGIMQVTIPTARDFDQAATPQKLNEPEYSVRIASQYIAWVQLRFSKSDPRFLEWVIKSYNQGVGNTFKEINGGQGFANNYFLKFKKAYESLGTK